MVLKITAKSCDYLPCPLPFVLRRGEQCSSSCLLLTREARSCSILSVGAGAFDSPSNGGTSRGPSPTFANQLPLASPYGRGGTACREVEGNKK